MLSGDIPQKLDILLFLDQEAVVGRYTFNDNGSDLLVKLGKGSFYRFSVVKWDNNGFISKGFGYACR